MAAKTPFYKWPATTMWIGIWIAIIGTVQIIESFTNWL